MRGGGHRQRAKGHLSGRRVCHLIFQRFIIQIISYVRSFQTALIISKFEIQTSRLTDARTAVLIYILGAHGLKRR